MRDARLLRQQEADILQSWDVILTRFSARRGGTLEIFGWGCAAGTLESLTYTRASSAEFPTLY